MHGAYGFEVEGLDDPAAVLHPVPAGWPRLTLERATPNPAPDREAPPAGTVRADDATAELWLEHGDHISVDRDSMAVRFHTRKRLSDEVVLHPFLGLPAAIAGSWLGRLALHGGVFLQGGGAWALLGGQEAGKSSTLGELLRRGHHVLTDDIVVVEGTTVFAGPRSIDLREEAAAELGGEELGRVGNRDRWRLRPHAGVPAAPLCGFVALEWGAQHRIEDVDAAERLSLLVSGTALRPREDDALRLLDLAALPLLRLVRPRDLGSLRRGVDLLTKELG